jgi:hypothetical protein
MRIRRPSVNSHWLGQETSQNGIGHNAPSGRHRSQSRGKLLHPSTYYGFELNAALYWTSSFSSTGLSPPSDLATAEVMPAVSSMAGAGCHGLRLLTLINDEVPFSSFEMVRSIFRSRCITNAAQSAGIPAEYGNQTLHAPTRLAVRARSVPRTDNDVAFPPSTTNFSRTPGTPEVKNSSSPWWKRIRVTGSVWAC